MKSYSARDTHTQPLSTMEEIDAVCDPSILLR
jgi:hypothetical protein